MASNSRTTKPKSSTASLVEKIKTPLQLLALPVVVIEIVLLVLASSAQGVERLILIVGMLVILGAVVGAAYALARETKIQASTTTIQPSDDNRTVRIEGDYLADGNPNYPVAVRHLSGNIYEIVNPTWHGVGIVIGQEYHGVYVYGDNAYPEYFRNTWGAHRAMYDPKNKSFHLKLVQLSPTPPIWEEGAWLRAPLR